MGLSTDLFIGPAVEEEFLCPMCHDVLQNPMQVEPCEHVYCRGCIHIIQPWNGKPGTCPKDRIRFTGERKPHRLFLSLLNNLKMRCPFTANGCPVVSIKLGNFHEHDLTCEYNPGNQKECEAGCGAVLNRQVRKSQTHNCIEYLKDQLQGSKTELEDTKQQLQTTRRELATTQVKLTSYQDQHEPQVSGSKVTGGFLAKKPRLTPKSAVPAAVCIHKWGISTECCEKIAEVIAVGAAVARGFESHLEWRAWYIGRLRAEVMCNVPAGFSLSRLKWTLLDVLEDMDSDPSDEDEKMDVFQGGMKLVVDDKLWVKILLNRAMQITN